MMKTDPNYSVGDLHICRDCGTGVEDAEEQSRCPKCGGTMRNTTVAHD